MGIEIVYDCSSAISVYFSVYEEWIFALIVLGRIYLFYYHIMPVHEWLEFVSIKKLIVYLLIKYVLRRWAGWMDGVEFNEQQVWAGSLKHDGPERKWPVGVAAGQLELTGRRGRRRAWQIGRFELT